MEIENATNDSVKEEDDLITVQEKTSIWITGEVILVTITIFTLYIFLSLIYYSWRRRLAVRVSGNIVETRERYLLLFCNFAIFFAVVRCILHQCILWAIDLKSVDQCREFVIVSTITYNITICLTYMYMWLRLRNFYNSADIVKLRTLWMEVADWIVFVLLVIVSIVMAIMTFVIPMKDEWVSYHVNRCNAFEYSNKTVLIVYACLACVFQSMLLGLYIYPVLYLRREHKKEKETPGSNSNLSLALYTNIKRSLLLLIICIFTDASVSTAASRLTKYHPQLFVSILALYDVNLVINVVCAICTFRNWKKIIFGFPLIRKLIDTRDSVIKMHHKTKRNSCKSLSEFDTNFDSSLDHTTISDTDTSSVDSDKRTNNKPVAV